MVQVIFGTEATQLILWLSACQVNGTPGTDFYGWEFCDLTSLSVSKSTHRRLYLLVNWLIGDFVSCVCDLTSFHIDWSMSGLVVLVTWPSSMVYLLCAVMVAGVQWRGRRCCPSYASCSRSTWKVIWWPCSVLPTGSNPASSTTSAAPRNSSRMSVHLFSSAFIAVPSSHLTATSSAVCSLCRPSHEARFLDTHLLYVTLSGLSHTCTRMSATVPAVLLAM